MTHTEHSNGSSGFLSRYGLALAVFVVVIGYFLWAEHEAHVKLAIPYLPYLLLLLCPLMHLFMHGGHGGHGHGDRSRTETKRRDGDAP